MRRRCAGSKCGSHLVVASWCVGGLVLGSCAPVCAGQWELASASSTQEQGDRDSGTPSLTLDGRCVAFESRATNLVPGDTNEAWDVFVRDRWAATTERISVANDGVQGNRGSGGARISADGRFVAFHSDADNLVPGDTNGKRDVFVRDRLSATTERISIGDDGAQGNGDSSWASMSGDGRFVAFESSASNLVPGDINNAADIFVRDRLTNRTVRVSVASDGVQGNAASESAALSADGQWVAFVSSAANLAPGAELPEAQVFVRDIRGGTTQCVSPRFSATSVTIFRRPAISGDGRFVAFALSPQYADVGGSKDCGVYVLDQQSGETVTLASGAHTFYGDVSVSADGRYVLFAKVGCFWMLIAPPLAEDIPSRAPAGQKQERAGQIMWDCSDYRFLVHDLVRGQTMDLWHSPEDFVTQRGDGLALSGDGRWLAFTSDARALVPSDTNRATDVFAIEWAAPPPETGITSYLCGETGSGGRSTLHIYWQGCDAAPDLLLYSWRLDGGAWSEPTTRTWLTLDEVDVSDGRHVLEVKAIDPAGNQDPTPARCEFTLDSRGPTVAILSPTNGATVRGIVKIGVTASDPSGVGRVFFFVRGRTACLDESAPYECEWDTRLPTGQGPARICVRADDRFSQSTEQCVDVTVDNRTFVDIPLDDPLLLVIEILASRGMTNGCSTSPPLFCPYAAVTRGQVAAFVCKAAGKTLLDRPAPTFADVPRNHPFYGWIERFSDPDSWGGSAPGTPCAIFGGKKFCPTASVSRQQIAWMLCRATGKAPLVRTAPTFADVPNTNPYYGWIERLADPASWPGEIAVTNGCACPSTYPQPARCYCPKSPLTRAQLAVLLVRAFGLTLRR